MYLIQSWRDSLTLFRPKSFKLFALVTIKTIKEAYGVLAKHFWWFVVLYFLCEYSFELFEVPALYAALVERILFSAWTFLICLSVRASIEKKTDEYFWHRTKYFAGMLIGTWFINILFTLAVTVSWVFFIVTAPLAVLGMIITGLFFVFFFLDMPLELENWARALKYSFTMFFYNIWGVMLLMSLVFFVYWLVLFGITYVAGVQDGALIERAYNFFTEPITVSVLSNFYIKRLHEQPYLYFKQPKE